MRVLLLVGALLISDLAAAQPYQAPPAPERHGLFGGGGLFGGEISCDGSSCGGFREAGGASGHIGWMFDTRLGILLDLWAMTSRQNNTSVTFVATTFNLRYYLAKTVWVQGGLGNGHAVVTVLGFSGRGDDVPAASIGIGVEVVRGRSWALDIAFKLAQGGNTDRGSGNDDVTTGRSTGIGAHVTLFGTR